MPREFVPYLPLLAVSIPLISFFLIIIAQQVSWWRNGWTVAGCTGALAAVVMLYPEIAGNQTVYLAVPMIITPFSLTFNVDGLGFMIALAASFIWLMAAVFSVEYMNHEKNRGRFFALFMLTLAGTLGVFLAGDLLTLLIFFEIMSLASYVLVVHTQTDEAYQAGNLYLYMGVFGGMCLLTGIGLIYFECGTLEIASLACLLQGLNSTTTVAAILMVVGFGIKAGMVPLHIWLPKAHPVAPAPASALLSGIMIKTGAYGLIRTLNMLYTPGRETISADSLVADAAELWASLSEAGFVIIWVGIVTMFFGVLLAVIQDNIKKMLACSSISQIGYIIMGIGVGAYLGFDGAMGVGGAAYHILNHAFFKSTLFLAAGAIVYLTGELDMSRLGGLSRKMPFTTVVVLIASLGITGVPLFNGYAGKTLLHHAIVEAYEHHHLVSLYTAEIIFTVTSAGTVFYFIKFLYFTFFRRAPEEMPPVKGEPLLMKLSMGILGAAMLVIGFSPNLVLTRLIGPALGQFTLDSYSLNYLLKSNFWNLQDLGAVFLALTLGAAFFYFLGLRTSIFSFRLPYWLGADFFGMVAGRIAIIIWVVITFPFIVIQNILGRIMNRVYKKTFLLLQSVDYRPGQKAIFRSINISNIDFDMILILLSFSVILTVVFYLRFGLKVLN